MKRPAFGFILVSQLFALISIIDAEIRFREHVLAGGIRGSNNVQSLSFSDFDNDKDLDIIVPSENALNWFENKGTARFEPHAVRETGAYGEHALPMDVDGDGDCDIVRTIRTENQIYTPIIRIDWLENTGNQFFSKLNNQIAPEYSDQTYLSSQVASADIDHDGDIDFSITSGYRFLYWFEHTADKKFIPHMIFSGRKIYDGPVCNVDIDHDNDIDIVMGGDSLLLVFINDGQQNFLPDTIASSSEPWYQYSSISIADMNRDGKTDIVAAMGYGLDWYENQGDMHFVKHLISDSAHAEKKVCAADLDNDGDMDLVAASWLNKRLSWYENDGNQNFIQHILNSTVYGPTAVYALDIDNDDDNDLFSTSCEDDVVSFYQNMGDGTFSHHILSTFIDSLQFTLAADMDNDGDKDIVTSGQGKGNLVWYEIIDAEKFIPHFISFDGNKLQALALSDIDRDGDVDIVRPVNDLVCYENDGTGAFTTKNLFPSIATVSGFSAKDIDGDGDIDAIASLSNYWSIVRYSNDGNLNFSADTLVDSAFNVRDMQVIDFDKDGDQDILAIVNASKIGGISRIIIYENDGAWNLIAHFIAGPGINAQKILPADIDGDGDLDILKIPGNPRMLPIFENVGNFNFSPDTLMLDTNGLLITICDLDKDSDVDLLVKLQHDTYRSLGWLENLGQKKFTVQEN